MSDFDQSALRELAAAYALGALDPAEARAFEQFLATSPEVRREVAEYREINALMADAAAGIGPLAPDPSLRQRVLDRIGREKVAPIRRGGGSRVPGPVWTALAASLVAAVGLGIALKQENDRVVAREATIQQLQRELGSSEARLAAREATLNAILEPDVRLTTLVSPADPKPVVQLFLNPAKRLAIMHAFNLRPTAAGRAYQLWFIPKSGKPIPSVTFNSEASGHALVQQIEVPPYLDLSAAAITDEPASGSRQPTTPVLMVGPLPAS